MVGNIVEIGNIFENKQLLGSVTIDPITWRTDSYTPSGYKQVSLQIHNLNLDLAKKIRASKFVCFEMGFLLSTSINIVEPMLLDVENCHNIFSSEGIKDYRTVYPVTRSYYGVVGWWDCWLSLNDLTCVGGQLFYTESKADAITAVTVNVYKLA